MFVSPTSQQFHKRGALRLYWNHLLERAGRFLALRPPPFERCTAGPRHVGRQLRNRRKGATGRLSMFL